MEEFNLKQERKKISPFAELDEARWQELMDIIEKQDNEFIGLVKEIYANCDYNDFDRTFAIDNLNKLAGNKNGKQ